MRLITSRASLCGSERDLCDTRCGFVLIALSVCVCFTNSFPLFLLTVSFMSFMFYVSPHTFLIFLENISSVGVTPLAIHRTLLHHYKCHESNFQINLILQ